MNHITTTDLLEHLKWRYATKQFDPTKTIAPEIWTALEDALVLTPSSYGLQPWKFLVVTSAVLVELGDAVADELALPFDRIS